MADESQLLARYLWEERQSRPGQVEMDTGSQSYPGDAWVSDENLMMARYLWEERQSRPGQVEMDTGSQSYLGDAWVSDENLMMARYLWEEGQADQVGSRWTRAPSPTWAMPGCRMRT